MRPRRVVRFAPGCSNDAGLTTSMLGPVVRVADAEQ
jgi:hypothetical protein